MRRDYEFMRDQQDFYFLILCKIESKEGLEALKDPQNVNK